MYTLGGAAADNLDHAVSTQSADLTGVIIGLHAAGETAL